MSLDEQIKYDTRRLGHARKNLSKAKADVDKLAKNFDQYVEIISANWRTDGGMTRKTEFENASNNLKNYSKSMEVLDALIGKLIAAAEYANSINGGE